ncbi:MAG: hypothetical protein NTW03_01820 [Verrucomicrobia bacterium]|nr:hypothetical protein [Verrucomicrobiota bacterium]
MGDAANLVGKDYWLYPVFHCAPACRQAGAEPSLNIIQNPATLDWQPIVKVEHYRLRQDSTGDPMESQLNPRQRMIVAQILKTGAVTSGWCRKRFGITYDTANRDLLGLMRLGIIERKSSGPGTRYELAARTLGIQ